MINEIPDLEKNQKTSDIKKNWNKLNGKVD